MSLMTEEEKREAFGSSSKNVKKDWDGPEGPDAAGKGAGGSWRAREESGRRPVGRG